jgi:formate/nitrite transporter FocA (FNT family)
MLKNPTGEHTTGHFPAQTGIVSIFCKLFVCIDLWIAALYRGDVFKILIHPPHGPE